MDKVLLELKSPDWECGYCGSKEGPVDIIEEDVYQYIVVANCCSRAKCFTQSFPKETLESYLVNINDELEIIKKQLANINYYLDKAIRL